MNPSDQELVRRVVAGDDREAFGELIDRHKRGVFSLLTRLLGRSSEVEDIAQNVFLAVYRGIHAFKGKAQFGTWIYRIAYNQACSELRKRKSIEAREHNVDDDQTEGAERPLPDPRGATQEDEVLREQVWRAVDRLPMSLRAALELHYRLGMRYPEIAEALSLPLGTVKTHLHRAREQLRQVLAGSENRVEEYKNG